MSNVPGPNEMIELTAAPSHDGHTMRFSVDVSMRQLVESRYCQRELVDYVLTQLGGAIVAKVEQHILTGKFDHQITESIRTAIAAEVKRAVAEHVNDKVEEFINEALS